MKRKLLLFALLLAAFLPLQAQTTTAVQTKTDEAELRRQAFEKVWTTVNEKHYDPTFGGVDWQKMRALYEPQALAAKTLPEFHAVLRRMLGELKLSHFGIFPRETPNPNKESHDGVIGIEIKMIDNEPVIYRVEKDSPAAKAGLKAGFIIRAIDGKTIRAMLAPLERVIAERTSNENVKKLYRERFVAVFLGGKPETRVRVEVLNARNRAQTFDVARYLAKAEMSEPFGNFPAQEVVFETKQLENSIGYLRFNIWVMPQMAKIRDAFRALTRTRGIIIDLRGNPGGIGGMATGLAGLLMNERVSLGSMKSRLAEQKFIVYPQSDPYTGKIVILTDYGTASTSEVLAAGLQDLGRAAIVGERSMGAVLPSIFDTLPTGAIFQYVISDYKSPKNVLVEGRGVTPDREVKQTRAALLAGRDLPLEAAVKLILN